MRGWWIAVTSLVACADPSAPSRPDAGVRCVATGIADPRAITFEIEPGAAGNDCSSVPEILVDGGAPALFVGDPDPRQPLPQAIGSLRCWGYAPDAEVTLSVALALRVAPVGGARLEDCRCHHVSVDRVQVSASVNGGTAIALPLAGQVSSDTICRDGPSHRGSYAVRTDARGEVRVELALLRCQVQDDPARCLFVQGTRVTLSPPQDPDAGR